ncbi:MAG: hypothetical protein IJ558_09510 [Treponema sp.]|nr:hypothetical protein [Treponema sp.]
MESIRILQDTYEGLYAITSPIVDLLESELTKVTSWKQKCDSILKKHTGGKIKEWSYFCELDLYYLLILLKEEWNDLESFSDSTFFTDDNKKLFVSENENSVLNIRNNVSHPENWDYDINQYRIWKKVLKKAAIELGSSMEELLYELHKPERERMLSYILDNTTNITLKSDKLPDDIRNSVLHTRDMLKSQMTAAGIITFFSDALKSE